jgi:hypothetical protein
VSQQGWKERYSTFPSPRLKNYTCRGASSVRTESQAMKKWTPGLFCILFLSPILISCGGMQAQSGAIQSQIPASQYANVDDNPELSGWDTCVIGLCPGGGTPGGSNPPASYSFTNGVTTHSCDGASAYLTETSAKVEDEANSNILASYMAGSQDTVNSFVSSFCFYLTGTVDEAEFDTFQFNVAKNTEFMFGTQCVTGGDWEIWNQKAGSWVSLGVRCSLSFDMLHKMSKTMHWNPSDTGDCAGQICMYYDAMVLDGTTLCSPCGSPQPSGALPDGWSSNAGFQFQIDITAPNQTGGMYIDLADFSASP